MADAISTEIEIRNIQHQQCLNCHRNINLEGNSYCGDCLRILCPLCKKFSLHVDGIILEASPYTIIKKCQECGWYNRYTKYR